MENKDCGDRFRKFWTSDRITAVLKMAEKKKHAVPFVSQLGTLSTVDIERMFGTLFLFIYF